MGTRIKQTLPLLALAASTLLAACGEAVVNAPGSGQGVSVRVVPSAVSITASGTVQYLSTVTGTAETGVAWSLREGTACGSISATGLFKAVSASGTCHVVATSLADPSKAAVSTVTVQACQQAVCRTGVDCGTMTDGCGGTLDCGAVCYGTATCGGGGAANTCGGGGSDGLFLGGFFPIGVFAQMPTEFPAWMSIGINTVQDPGGRDVEWWADGARALGLKQIRQPIGSTRATPPAAADYSSMHQDPDYGTGNVIAWNGVMPNGTAWDEIEWSIGPGVDTANYAINTGAALHALDGTTPTFLNSGINGLSATPSGWPYTGGDYSYADLFQTIDWISNDIYPYGGSSYNESAFKGERGGDHVVSAADVAQWPRVAPIEGKGAIASIGAITDNLRATLPGRPIFAILEAGCVTASSPVVPPAGIRAEIWDAIIHGVRGVIFFAYSGQLNRPTSDGGGCGAVPAANQAEIRAQSAVINALAHVLQDEINPATIGATVSLPALDAGWRDTPSGKYFFVLNTTNLDQGSATVTLSGIGGATSATVLGEGRSVPISGGKIVDDFPNYALHIYLVE